jgi:hypothetical protein
VTKNENEEKSKEKKKTVTTQTISLLKALNNFFEEVMRVVKEKESFSTLTMIVIENLSTKKYL